VNITIRPERPCDIAAVREVNDRAFGQPNEGRIVDLLRGACNGTLSLVALAEGQVAGHVLFTPATIEGPVIVRGLGLGPMAVLPEFQGKGVGKKLVETALTSIRASNCPFIVVLGHPEFYTRFGFQPASDCRLTCPWAGVPNDAFMVLVVDEPVMAKVSGVVRYRDEFNETG
jgi:putative acetyltransferase